MRSVAKSQRMGPNDLNHVRPRTMSYGAKGMEKQSTVNLSVPIRS